MTREPVSGPKRLRAEPVRPSLTSRGLTAAFSAGKTITRPAGKPASGSCGLRLRCGRRCGRTVRSSGDPAKIADVQRVYRGATAQLTYRSPAQIERLPVGFDLAGSGLVRLPDWRPESAQAARGEQAGPEWMPGAVGRKKPDSRRLACAFPGTGGCGPPGRHFRLRARQARPPLAGMPGMRESRAGSDAVRWPVLSVPSACGSGHHRVP